MILISPLTLKAGELDIALQRFAELRTKAQAITKSSAEQDVISIFGKPQSTGNGGWGRFDTKVWTYLNYLDDSHYCGFTITLDPKQGCSFSATHQTRQEIDKKPLLVTTGKVLRTYPYTGEKNLRLLCDIQKESRSLERRSASSSVELMGYSFFTVPIRPLESITFTNPTSPGS